VRVGVTEGDKACRKGFRLEMGAIGVDVEDGDKAEAGAGGIETRLCIGEGRDAKGEGGGSEGEAMSSASREEGIIGLEAEASV
jgi:hypothetical protein